MPANLSTKLAFPVYPVDIYNCICLFPSSLAHPGSELAARLVALKEVPFSDPTTQLGLTSPTLNIHTVDDGSRPELKSYAFA